MTIPTKDKNENDLRILLGENNLQENEAQTPQAIALAKLHPFHEHPYKVEDNDEMAELCESIRTHGVLSPILVRPTEDGEYEIVSGHRRVFACRRLGLKEVPAIVQPMTREEAVLKMVDSNLHRDRLLPSEKAFAYKMKLDAVKHRGKSLSQVATKLNPSVCLDGTEPPFSAYRQTLFRRVKYALGGGCCPPQQWRQNPGQGHKSRQGPR